MVSRLSSVCVCVCLLSMSWAESGRSREEEATSCCTTYLIPSLRQAKTEEGFHFAITICVILNERKIPYLALFSSSPERQ